MVEQRPFKSLVPGSSPGRPTRSASENLPGRPLRRRAAADDHKITLHSMDQCQAGQAPPLRKIVPGEEAKTRLVVRPYESDQGLDTHGRGAGNRLAQQQAGE